MTRKEAIKAIKSHCYFANLVPVGKEALDMAIKALEQESVLDKIRDEICEYNNNTWKPNENSLGNAGWWACNKCIEIIDKYKAEREDKN